MTLPHALRAIEHLADLAGLLLVVAGLALAVLLLAGRVVLR
jgi:hypothetical protein